MKKKMMTTSLKGEVDEDVAEEENKNGNKDANDNEMQPKYKAI